MGNTILRRQRRNSEIDVTLNIYTHMNYDRAAARRILAQHGIFCEGKRAQRLTKADYQEYDYIIGMDSENMRWMQRMLDGDPEGKLSLLMDYENTFSATVTVTVSRQFFGWLTAIGSELKLAGPLEVKQQYKEYLEEILTGMEESG